MAWSAPPTAVTGAIITAAFWNTGGRDNLNDLDRRTSPVAAQVTTEQGTTSTSYTDMATAGPAVTVTVGSTTKVVLSLYAYMYSSTDNGTGLMAFGVTGGTAIPATDAHALAWTSPTALSGVRHGMTAVISGINAGSNTFTAKYRSTLGTNTASAGDRRLWVTPLGA